MKGNMKEMDLQSLNRIAINASANAVGATSISLQAQYNKVKVFTRV